MDSRVNKGIAFDMWRAGYRPVEDEVCVFTGSDGSRWLHEGAVWREALKIQGQAKAILREQTVRASAALPREQRVKPRQRRARPLVIETPKRTFLERMFG